MSRDKDSKMGLPRVSGKRQWSEVSGEEENVSCKILCTSPPHAICAEDVIQNTPPANAEDSVTTPPDLTMEVSETADFEHLTDISEDEQFLDDEEDKDSGFIDGNSIDNSTDDEMDSKGSNSSQNSTEQSTLCSPFSIKPSIMETELESMDYSYIFSQNSSLATSTLSDSLPISQTVQKTSSENEITTVTSALSGAAISSSYPLTQLYDHHQFTVSYTQDSYNRPGTPSWSCNFYDGSNPNTNKYMEISPPSRTLPSQSIQCDENGKSYIELGSVSQYTHSYSECANFTTSPSYQNSTFTSSFTSGYTEPPYYNGQRQPYNSPGFSYTQQQESYANGYENETCAYSYVGNNYSQSRPTLRPGQRCNSPYCDLTKRPRPPCYANQRQDVFGMSVVKLNRFSRYPEPSLHRSVLICNTLKYIEKELNSEGISVSSVLNHSQNYIVPNQPSTPAPSPTLDNADSMPSVPSPNQLNEGPLPSIHPPMGSPVGTPFLPSIQTPNSPSQNVSYTPLVPFQSFYSANESVDTKESPRPYHISNGEVSYSNDNAVDAVTWGRTEEKTESINWCSVLLSSQSDLDSANNNECSTWSDEGSSRPNQSSQLNPVRLPSLSADDVLKSIPDGRRRDASDELNTLIEDMLS